MTQLTDLVNAGEGSQSAVDIGDGIFMSRGISNAYLVTTSDGDVMVNTGINFEAEETKRRFEEVSDGPVRINVSVPSPAMVEWSVFTLNFRKITSGQISVNSTGIVQWDLRDKNGARVADGLYYIRVEVLGPNPVTKVYKVLVLH